MLSQPKPSGPVRPKRGFQPDTARPRGKRKEERGKRKAQPTYHILISVLDLLKLKHFLIHNRFQANRIDRPDHLLELQPTTHKQPPDCTAIIQSLQKAGLVLGFSAGEESNNADHAVYADGLEGLCYGFRTSYFENVVDPKAAWREGFGGAAPIGIVLVIDNMVGAKRFKG